MMAVPILQLNNISKRYGSTQALNDVSMDLYPGEVHALMGENGAGKSTLMKILSGNIVSDTGNIFLDGKPIEIKTPEDASKYRIAIIHQQ
ncbi:MAG: ATP-binding cassette domain-containing protein, partial [Dysgonomonas sp.]